MAPITFLTLPLEVREKIYGEVFTPIADDDHPKNPWKIADEAITNKGKWVKYDLGLLRTNTQLHDEATRFFKANHVFVRVSLRSPSSLGTVRSILVGQDAERFTGHSMEVRVTVPKYDGDPTEYTNKLGPSFRHHIVRAEDLSLLIAHWVTERDDWLTGNGHVNFFPYSSLDTTPAINLHLRNPDAGKTHAGTLVEASHSPARQRLLLLPFANLIGATRAINLPNDRPLSSIAINVTGDVPVLPEMEAELHRRRAAPFDPKPRVDRAKCLIEQGDKAVAARDPTAAMAKYRAALLAMDILTGHRMAPEEVSNARVIFECHHARELEYNVSGNDLVEPKGTPKVLTWRTICTHTMLHHFFARGVCSNPDCTWNPVGRERQRLYRDITARIVRGLHSLGKVEDALAWGMGAIKPILEMVKTYQTTHPDVSLPEIYANSPGRVATGLIFYYCSLMQQEKGHQTQAMELLDVAFEYAPEDPDISERWNVELGVFLQ